MSAAPPTGPPAAPVASPVVRPRRNPALGIVAFAIAAFWALVPDLSIALEPMLTDDDMNGIAGLAFLFSLVPTVLAIIAIVLRRGRAWGVAAIALTLVSTIFAFALGNDSPSRIAIVWLVRSIFG